MLNRAVIGMAAAFVMTAPPPAAAGAPQTRASGADLALILADKPGGGWAFDNGQEFAGAKGDLTLDDTVPPARRPALRLRGDFSGGGKYVQAGTALPAKPIDALSFWIKAPGAEMGTLRLTDSTGQCHQIKLKLESAAGWQKVYLPVAELFRRMSAASSLPIVARYEKWGGANDGKWHGPGKGLYILLGEGSGGREKTGVLWLSDIRFLPRSDPPGATTAVTKTVRLDEVLQEGEVDWAFTLGQEFPGAKGALELVKDQPRPGAAALRMRGDFSGGGAYVAATKMPRVSGRTQDRHLRIATSTSRCRRRSPRARCHVVRSRAVISLSTSASQ